MIGIYYITIGETEIQDGFKAKARNGTLFETGNRTTKKNRRTPAGVRRFEKRPLLIDQADLNRGLT